MKSAVVYQAQHFHLFFSTVGDELPGSCHEQVQESVLENVSRVTAEVCRWKEHQLI
jgi:hypothetical protein